jgi:hypothetical protein
MLPKEIIRKVRRIELCRSTMPEGLLDKKGFIKQTTPCLTYKTIPKSLIKVFMTLPPSLKGSQAFEFDLL